MTRMEEYPQKLLRREDDDLHPSCCASAMVTPDKSRRFAVDQSPSFETLKTESPSESSQTSCSDFYAAASNVLLHHQTVTTRRRSNKPSMKRRLVRTLEIAQSPEYHHASDSSWTSSSSSAGLFDHNNSNNVSPASHSKSLLHEIIFPSDQHQEEVFQPQRQPQHQIPDILFDESYKTAHESFSEDACGHETPSTNDKNLEESLQAAILEYQNDLGRISPTQSSGDDSNHAPSEFSSTREVQEAARNGELAALQAMISQYEQGQQSELEALHAMIAQYGQAQQSSSSSASSLDDATTTSGNNQFTLHPPIEVTRCQSPVDENNDKHVEKVHRPLTLLEAQEKALGDIRASWDEGDEDTCSQPIGAAHAVTPEPSQHESADDTLRALETLLAGYDEDEPMDARIADIEAIQHWCQTPPASQREHSWEHREDEVPHDVEKMVEGVQLVETDGTKKPEPEMTSEAVAGDGAPISKLSPTQETQQEDGKGTLDFSSMSAKRKSKLLIRELQHIHMSGTDMFNSIDEKINSWQQHESKQPVEPEPDKNSRRQKLLARIAESEQHELNRELHIEHLKQRGSLASPNLMRELQYVQTQGDDIIDSIHSKVECWQKQESKRRFFQLDSTSESPDQESFADTSSELEIEGCEFDEFGGEGKSQYSEKRLSHHTESTQSVCCSSSNNSDLSVEKKVEEKEVSIYSHTRSHESVNGTRAEATIVVEEADTGLAVVTPDHTVQRDLETITVEITVHSYIESWDSDVEEWTVMDSVESQAAIYESFDFGNTDVEEGEEYGVVGHGVSDNVSVKSDLTAHTLSSFSKSDRHPSASLVTQRPAPRSISVESNGANIHQFPRRIRTVRPPPQRALPKTRSPFETVKLRRAQTNPSRLPQMRNAALLRLLRNHLHPVGFQDSSKPRAPTKIRRCYSDKVSRVSHEKGEMAQPKLVFDSENEPKCILDYSWNELDAMDSFDNVCCSEEFHSVVDDSDSVSSGMTEITIITGPPSQTPIKDLSPRMPQPEISTVAEGERINQSNSYYQSVSVSFLTSSVRDNLVVNVVEEALRILQPGGVLNVLDRNGSVVERIQKSHRFPGLVFHRATAEDQKKHETNTLSILEKSGIKTKFQVADPSIVHWTAVKPYIVRRSSVSLDEESSWDNPIVLTQVRSFEDNMVAFKASDANDDNASNPPQKEFKLDEDTTDPVETTTSIPAPSDNLPGNDVTPSNITVAEKAIVECQSQENQRATSTVHATSLMRGTLGMSLDQKSMMEEQEMWLRDDESFADEYPFLGDIDETFSYNDSADGNDNDYEEPETMHVTIGPSYTFPSHDDIDDDNEDIPAIQPSNTFPLKIRKTSTKKPRVIIEC